MNACWIDVAPYLFVFFFYFILFNFFFKFAYINTSDLNIMHKSVKIRNLSFSRPILDLIQEVIPKKI